MNNFDDFSAFDDTSSEVAASSSKETLWNILTVVVLMGMLCVGGYFLMIFVNPQSGINPFPPPTLPATISLPTSTPTPRLLPPTWTATMAPPSITPSALPSATGTPEPPTATNTPVIIPTNTPVVETVQPTSMPFILQPGNPQPIAASIIGHDCNWMGVGGQAFDISGQPILGLVVKTTGTVNGQAIEIVSLTGTSTQFYGPGGYEVQLADTPIATTGALQIQLFDAAGLPLSGLISFDTFGGCDKNAILINFNQVHP